MSSSHAFLFVKFLPLPSIILFNAFLNIAGGIESILLVECSWPLVGIPSSIALAPGDSAGSESADFTDAQYLESTQAFSVPDTRVGSVLDSSSEVPPSVVLSSAIPFLTPVQAHNKDRMSATIDD